MRPSCFPHYLKLKYCKTLFKTSKDFQLGEVMPLGKVRTEVVKRYAREILSSYPEHFTNDFESNKQKLFSITEIKSKRLRNRIAGYITHLVKIGETRISVVE